MIEARTKFISNYLQLLGVVEYVTRIDLLPAKKERLPVRVLVFEGTCKKIALKNG